MKKIICLSIISMSVSALFAQKVTFDLISYTPPKDSTGANWQKEVTENTTIYTVTNSIIKSWCRIIIEKSTISKGSIDLDFESEWKGLVVKNYKPTGSPKLNEVQEIEGWKIKSGGANFIFENRTATVLLTTATGYNRCISIVAIANSQNYIKDIEAVLASVDLKESATNTQQLSVNIDDKNSVTGTWKKTGSVNPSYQDAYATSIAGYTSDQYTFNSNGTYSFVSKTFGMSLAKILLVKENGTFQISEDNITIIPQKSVIEAWSKKDGSDKWGKLLSTQNRTVEKVTYQFTKHYFSGITMWNLVLQNDKATQRDGPHSSNNTFANAWYYSPITSYNPTIKLPN